jgi:polyhydroxyalkanoate synthesis regulator phasin
MLEAIRKGLMTGFGAVILTKEKIESVTHKLVQEAKMTQEDAERLTEELFSKGETQWQEFDNLIRDSIRKILENLNVGSKEAVEALSQKIQNFETRIALLENSLNREKQKED